MCVYTQRDNNTMHTALYASPEVADGDNVRGRTGGAVFASAASAAIDDYNFQRLRDRLFPSLAEQGGGAARAGKVDNNDKIAQQAMSALNSGKKAIPGATGMMVKLMTYGYNIAIGLVVLGLVLCIIAGVYIVINIAYPRTQMMGRSSPFQRYMKTYNEDLIMRLRSVNTTLTNTPRFVLYSVGSKDAKNLKQCDANNFKSKLQVHLIPDARVQSSCVLEPLFNIILKQFSNLMLFNDQQFESNLTTYFKFYKSIKRYFSRPRKGINCARSFAKQELLHDERFKGKDDDLDETKVENFHKDVFMSFEKLRQALLTLSSELSTWCGMYHQIWYDPAIHEFVTQIHHLRMMLIDYHGQIVTSYDTRKTAMSTLQFNIFSMYYAPYAADVYRRRIPKIWKKFPRNFLNAFKVAERGWTWVGKKIAQVPCLLAYAGEKRQQDKMCKPKPKVEKVEEDVVVVGEDGAQIDDGGGDMNNKDIAEGAGVVENFVGPFKTIGDVLRQGNGVDEGDADVIEKFGGPFKAIGDFFKGFSIIVVLIKDIAKNPFGTLKRIFLLLLGIIIGLVLVILYALITIMGIPYIIGWFYAVWTVLVLTVLMTVLEVLLSLVMALLYTLLWLVDLATSGYVVRSMRCENLPDEWETQPHYAWRNRFERTILMCTYPCRSRFRPANDLSDLPPIFVTSPPLGMIVGLLMIGVPVCVAVPKHIPDYCPQQQIIRLSRGQNLSETPNIFDTYTPESRFWTKEFSTKWEIIDTAFHDKKKYMLGCMTGLKRFDYMSRHICANAKNMPGQTDDDKKKKTLMCRLCTQIYCEHHLLKIKKRNKVRIRNASEQARVDCLCASLSTICKTRASGSADDDDDVTDDKSNPTNRLLATIVLLLSITLISACGVYALITASIHPSPAHSTNDILTTLYAAAVNA